MVVPPSIHPFENVYFGFAPSLFPIHKVVTWKNIVRIIITIHVNIHTATVFQYY